MKHMQADDPTIQRLLGDANSFFLIPVYQRPYSWGQEHCADLWLSLRDFAFPNDNPNAFNPKNDEYFLGVMHTYFNTEKQDEVIDGQQRLTTLLLLMRAFYEAMDNNTSTKARLGECIWLFDERHTLDKTSLKIVPEVLFDSGNESLKNILLTGSAPQGDNSCYAINYRFFQNEINQLKAQKPATFDFFVERLLANVYVVRLRSDSREHAQDIFATVNDTGLPLSDADIFKAELCRHFVACDDEFAKANFADSWQRRSNRCKKFFPNTKKISALEFAFLTYTYKEDAPHARKSLRSYYGADDYALLKNPQTLSDIDAIIDFFADLHQNNEMRFSRGILRKIYILLRFQKSVVFHALSSFFIRYRDDKNALDEENFLLFLSRLTAFMLGAAAAGKGGNYFAGHNFYPISILVKDSSKVIREHIFSATTIRQNMENFAFMNSKKAAQDIIINWWTFRDENQPLLPPDTNLEYEHIFAKKRARFDEWLNPNNIHCLGNLALLEPSLNRQAQNFCFADKRKLYLGYTNGKTYPRTFNAELRALAENKEEFSEQDILTRNRQITASLLSELEKFHFLQA